MLSYRVKLHPSQSSTSCKADFRLKLPFGSFARPFLNTVSDSNFAPFNAKALNSLRSSYSYLPTRRVTFVNYWLFFWLAESVFSFLYSLWISWKMLVCGQITTSCRKAQETGQTDSTSCKAQHTVFLFFNVKTEFKYQISDS